MTMNLDDKVNQLTALLFKLTPAVDSLVTNQKNTDDNITKLVTSQLKANLVIGELRKSNVRLASAIEAY